MQGLADGYFVLPYTIGDYLSDDILTGKISTDAPEFEAAEKQVQATIDKLLSSKGEKPVDYFHKRLGKIMWNKCGMSRNEKEISFTSSENMPLRELNALLAARTDPEEMRSEIASA